MYSPHVHFIPVVKKYNSNWEFKCPTAGSIGLMLQMIMPALCNPEKTLLTLEGGTTVDKSPPIYITQNVLEPLLSKLGINIECKLIKEGVHPIGKGVAQFTISSKGLKGANMSDRGDIIQIKVYSLCGIAYKEFAIAVCNKLRSAIGPLFPKVDIAINNATYGHPKCTLKYFAVILSSSNGFVLSAQFMDGKKEPMSTDVPISVIMKDVELYKMVPEICIDEFHSDQLLIYMVLAKAKSIMNIPRMSLHFETMIYLVRQFMPETIFKIDNSSGKYVQIIVDYPK